MFSIIICIICGRIIIFSTICKFQINDRTLNTIWFMVVMDCYLEYLKHYSIVWHMKISANATQAHQTTFCICDTAASSSFQRHKSLLVDKRPYERDVTMLNDECCLNSSMGLYGKFDWCWCGLSSIAAAAAYIEWYGQWCPISTKLMIMYNCIQFIYCKDFPGIKYIAVPAITSSTRFPGNT